PQPPGGTIPSNPNSSSGHPYGATPSSSERTQPMRTPTRSRASGWVRQRGGAEGVRITG
ncbi:hypothetical protein PDJAM_G00223140, partial [Pangasius djambal]|nr:hypothetical protein [Pangasius djambal]